MRKTVLKTDIILRNTQKAWSLYVYNQGCLNPMTLYVTQER
jgi:hypothetical protein